jgi:hypothetical protein
LSNLNFNLGSYPNGKFTSHIGKRQGYNGKFTSRKAKKRARFRALPSFFGRVQLPGLPVQQAKQFCPAAGHFYGHTVAGSSRRP